MVGSASSVYFEAHKLLKERALTALERGMPDAVPIYDSLDDSHVVRIMNSTQSTPRIKVECYKKLGFDAIPAKTRTYEKQSHWDHKRRLTVIDEWNRKYVYTEPHIKFYAGGVTIPEDASAFRFPDPERQSRYDEVRETVALAGKELAVIGVVGGPLERSVLSFGLIRFLPMLLRGDRIALEYMSKVKEYWIKVGKMEAEIGVDAIMITDDYAFKHGPFFSPRLFQNLIMPLLKEEVTAFKRLRVPVILHSDGNISLLLPLLVESGIDGIHSIEPSAGMDIGRVKQEYGDKLALVGNIDSGLLLSFGTPKEVEKAVKDTISKAALAGAYMLSSSNSLHYGCKLENILAMISAAKRYGVYPGLTK
jgi:uroporphyrinogen decarboxylase